MSKDVSKKKTKAQKEFAIKAQRKAEFQKEINKTAVLKAQELRSQNPEYSDLELKPANIAFIKGQKGMSKAFIKIAEVMMYPGNITRTQVSILEEVQEKFPNLTLRQNIWNKPLFAAMMKSVEAKVRGNMKEPVDLKGCKTLAEIKKRVKAAKIAADDTFTFKAKITFTGECVIIGRNSYPLILRKSGKNTYPCIRIDLKGKGRCWVRMDGLVAALQAA